MLSNESKRVVKRAARKAMKRNGATLEDVIRIMRESADYLESLKDKPDIIPEGELPDIR